MTGFFRILLFILIGYIIVKSFKFFKSIFNSISAKNEENKVHNSQSKVKIDRKDVIDAQFEEIDTKDKSSQQN